MLSLDWDDNTRLLYTERGAVEPARNSFKVINEAKSNGDMCKGPLQFVMELLTGRGSSETEW